MKKDILITYYYQHEETGRMLERDFWVSEIKRGEDDAHLKLIPNYVFVGMEVAK